MSERDDDLETFRSELSGLFEAPAPQDFGLQFRDPDALVRAAPARRRRIPRWTPAAMVAAVAGVLAFALLTAQNEPAGPLRAPDPTLSPELMTVAQVLDRAAAASGRSADVSRARYLRIESVQQQGSDPEEKRTIWLGHDVPGLLIDDFAGRTTMPPAVFGLQETRLSWDELIALPADPQALRSLLLREVRDLPRPSYYVVKLAAELLAESPAPPALRKALWTVIARSPGARLQGTVTDALGRTGYGIMYDAPGRARFSYVIDPSRGTILQTTIVPDRRGADTYRATYIEQRAVDRLPSG